MLDMPSTLLCRLATTLRHQPCSERGRVQHRGCDEKYCDLQVLAGYYCLGDSTELRAEVMTCFSNAVATSAMKVRIPGFGDAVCSDDKPETV